MRIKTIKKFLPVLCLAVFIFGTAFINNESTDDPLPVRPPAATPKPLGGKIVLQLISDEPVLDKSLWTVVQWQDSSKTWHDVDGWQGTFNEKLQISWWVAAEDLGSSTFRWIIKESVDEDEILAESNAFRLPYDKQEVLVEIYFKK